MKKLFYALMLSCVLGITSTFASNPLVNLTNDNASGSINVATEAGSWYIGYIVYFVLWMALLSYVIYVFRGFIPGVGRK